MILRIVLYDFGLIWVLLGISIIADTLVASIEAFTAHSRQVEIKPGKHLTEKVWNDAVTTLSILALGYLAPEIVLTVVDLFMKDFHFSPLGGLRQLLAMLRSTSSLSLPCA